MNSKKEEIVENSDAPLLSAPCWVKAKVDLHPMTRGGS